MFTFKSKKNKQSFKDLHLNDFGFIVLCWAILLVLQPNMNIYEYTDTFYYLYDIRMARYIETLIISQTNMNELIIKRCALILIDSIMISINIFVKNCRLNLT